jgi:O-antigen ligase/TPR repeat protein
VVFRVLRRRAQHDQILFLGWLLSVSLPMAWMGANRPWVWSWALAAVSALWLLALRGHGLRQHLQSLRLDITQGPRRAPLAWLAAAWLLSSAAYLLPIAQVDGAATRDLSAATQALALSLYYIGVFLLTVLVLDSKSKIKWGVLLVFSVAVVHAGVATVLHLVNVRVIGESWVFNPFGLSGFFYNRNHFAGYLEMHLGLGIGMLIAGLKLRSDDDRTWRQTLRDWVKVLLSAKAQIRLALVVLVIALVVTQSRSGNVAFFTAVIIVGLLAMRFMQQRPKALPVFLLSLIVIDLVIVGSWFGSDRLAERIRVTRIELPIESSGAGKNARTDATNATNQAPVDADVLPDAPVVFIDRERPRLVRDTLRMWRDAPIFGVGPGGFRSQFPAYRGRDLSPVFYDHAHNDYVQLLAERGLFGFALMLGIVLCCSWSALSALRERKSRSLSGLAFGVLVGLLAIGLHSVSDFNMRIPANAAFLSMLLALAWLSRYGSSDVSARRKTDPRAQPLANVIAAGLLLCAACSVSAAAEPLHCELGQAEVSASFPTLKQLNDRIALQKQALAANPKNESHLDAMQELAQLAIEAALANESIERSKDAAAYWRLARSDLASTHWRMGQQAKKGNLRARWLFAELKHPSGSAWDAASCNALADANGLETGGYFYRAALCTQSSDPALATELMQRSANAGHPAAAEVVGRLCLEKGARACAVEWLCKAVDAGRTRFAGTAAFLITEQAPSPLLAVRASALFEIAATQGDLASANNLGELYERGYIGRPNLSQAAFWYRQAAEKGLLAAQLNLAKLIHAQDRRNPEWLSWIAAAEKTDAALAQQVRDRLLEARN